VVSSRLWASHFASDDAQHMFARPTGAVWTERFDPHVVKLGAAICVEGLSVGLIVAFFVQHLVILALTSPTGLLAEFFGTPKYNRADAGRSSNVNLVTSQNPSAWK
jgi:hypothetical protein